MKRSYAKIIHFKEVTSIHLLFTAVSLEACTLASFLRCSDLVSNLKNLPSKDKMECVRLLVQVDRRWRVAKCMQTLNLRRMFSRG
jgi:hypothetical protein